MEDKHLQIQYNKQTKLRINSKEKIPERIIIKLLTSKN